jgi:antitoxin MazE
VVIKGTIRTWGNSLAVRIPKVVSEDLGIEENTQINMAVDDGLLVITPVSGRKKRLQKMLKQITRENLPDSKEPFGQSLGREAL